MLLPLSTNARAYEIWAMILAGIRLFLWGDEVIKLKYEDVVGDLAVFSIVGSFECLPIDMLGKYESESPTALGMWHERAMSFMDPTRHSLLLAHASGVRSGHKFLNVEYLVKSKTTDIIAYN